MGYCEWAHGKHQRIMKCLQLGRLFQIGAPRITVTLFGTPQTTYFHIHMSKTDGSTSTRPNFEREHEADPDSAARDGLREDFRNLSLLVTVAAAINNPNSTPRLSGDPLLGADSEGRIKYPDTDSTVMHAMTSILVLEHEILAGMSCDRSHVLVTKDDPESDHSHLVEDDVEGERYALDMGS